MHTIKFKHIFILLIFLFCSYGIWLPQGKSESVSIAKDFGQVFVNNNKETHPFDTGATYHQTVIAKEYPFTSEIKEEKDDSQELSVDKEQGNTPNEVKTSYLEEEKSPISHQVNTDEKESQDIKEKDISSHFPEPFPTTAYEKEALSEFGIRSSEISEETSPVNEDKQEIITDKNILSYVKEPVREITASEPQSPPIEQSGTQLPALNKISSPDIVEEKIPSSDTEGEKDLQRKPSVNEDDQKIVTEKEIYSATSLITLPNFPPDKEAPLIEEEGEDQISVADNKEQENATDEVKTSSLEEEKPLISHQVNADEKESEDIKEKDFPSHLSEHHPTTALEKDVLPEFGIKDSGISEQTPPVSEDKHEIITDKDVPLDVKEKETPPIISTAVPSTPASSERESLIKEENDTLSTTSKAAPSVHSPVEGESLVKEEKEAQASKVLDERQGIIPDEEGISLLQEEKSPIDYQPIGNDETHPQEPIREITEREETKYTWKIWHSDPTHGIILAVVITLIVAKIGGWIAKKAMLPEVVGKLILGMILGNIYLFIGADYFDFLKTMPFLKVLSYFGTLVLLLTAGLHTDLRALLRVGASSFLVCLGGIVAPAGLGIIVSYFLLPDISSGAKVLLAIVLCNTSTGLLFAILNELKAMNTLEGRVIVGATILTEIIVILTFGIVSGIVEKGGVSLLGISVSFGIALLFLITTVLIIFMYGEKFGNLLSKKSTDGLNVPIIVILSLLLALMFGSVGLHTVIGAFIAGLFLRNVKLRDSDDREYRNVESFIRPFYMLLVPILFVRVGALVDLKSFLNLDAMFLGLAITGAAVVGKLFCSICPIEKGINCLAVGIGMATKLEGTLILTGIGRDIGIFNDTIFSSLIMAIVFTSTICPFLMKTLLLRKNNMGYESICNDAEKKN